MEQLKPYVKPKMEGGSVELELDKEDVEELYTEGELVAVAEGKKLVRIKIRRPCEKCSGCGAIISYNTQTNRQEVQKCDACDKWSSDFQAWMAVEPAPHVDDIPEDLDAFMEDLDTHLKEDDENDREWV